MAVDLQTTLTPEAFAAFDAGLMQAQATVEAAKIQAAAAHSAALVQGILTFLAGVFALGAGYYTYKGAVKQAAAAEASVQAQINSQQTAEKERRSSERRMVETALTAELLVFATGITSATSEFNERAHKNAAAPLIDWPRLIHPRVYEAVITQIGLLEEGWPVAALITFYANVIELNEAAEHAVLGRPSKRDGKPESAASCAARFQMMASNLAEALDGLNRNRKFPMLADDPDAFITPFGKRVDSITPRPTNLQELLRLLGDAEKPKTIV